MKPLALFVAGTNGSGKSSLRGILNFNTKLVIIDPDEITKENGGNNTLGGRKVIELFRECINSKKSFVMETTLSGKSVLNRLKEAKNAGFKIKMIYVGLDSVDLNIQRVANRVAKGGHNIPTEAIIKRYNSSRENLIKSINLLDKLEIYDNTNNVELNFAVKNNEIIYVNKNSKQWVLDIKESIEIKLSKDSFSENMKKLNNDFTDIFTNSDDEKNTQEDKNSSVKKQR